MDVVQALKQYEKNAKELRSFWRRSAETLTVPEMKRFKKLRSSQSSLEEFDIGRKTTNVKFSNEDSQWREGAAVRIGNSMKADKWSALRIFNAHYLYRVATVKKDSWESSGMTYKVYGTKVKESGCRKDFRLTGLRIGWFSLKYGQIHILNSFERPNNIRISCDIYDIKL